MGHGLIMYVDLKIIYHFEDPFFLHRFEVSVTTTQQTSNHTSEQGDRQNVGRPWFYPSITAHRAISKKKKRFLILKRSAKSFGIWRPFPSRSTEHQAPKERAQVSAEKGEFTVRSADRKIDIMCVPHPEKNEEMAP